MKCKTSITERLSKHLHLHVSLITVGCKVTSPEFNRMLRVIKNYKGYKKFKFKFSQIGYVTIPTEQPESGE
jgi:hypothetical protein